VGRRNPPHLKADKKEGVMKFKVLRQHTGDRFYNPGDERDADEREVAHLLASGTLEKMADPVKNKAEPAVKNKAAK
jgi:hypothetical protein